QPSIIYIRLHHVYSSSTNHSLHSFPTRRSSDLRFPHFKATLSGFNNPRWGVTKSPRSHKLSPYSALQGPNRYYPAFFTLNPDSLFSFVTLSICHTKRVKPLTYKDTFV